MNTSEKIGEMAKALAAFQKEVKPIKKDGTNPHFKSKYAKLDSIMDAVRPLLSAQGLVLIQSQNATRLLHTSGEWIEVTVDLAPSSGKPQDYGSAMTYARRYGASAILGLATEDDDDGNAAQAASTRKPAAPAPKTGKLADSSTLLGEVLNTAAAAGWTKADLQALVAQKGVKEVGELPTSTAPGLMQYLTANAKNVPSDPAIDDIFGGSQ